MCSDGDDDSDTVFTDSEDEDDLTETELEDIIETDNEKSLRGRIAGARPISFQSFHSLEAPSF